MNEMARWGLVLSLVQVGVVSAQASEELFVWAPPGTTDAVLGGLYDAHFRPVRGSAYRGEAVDSPASDTYRMVVEQMSRVELEARARFPGVAGQLNLGHSETMGYIRAIALRRVVKVPPTVEVHPRPGAAYFVSEIRYGFAYELRVMGSSTEVGAAVRGIAGGGSASLTTQQVRIEGGTRGLVPNGSELEAMAARTPEQILSRFTTEDAQPQALFLKLEALPVDAEDIAQTQQHENGQRFEVHVVSIAFPNRNTRRNNFPWDALGGLPDMAIQFWQNGQMLRQIAAPRNQVSHSFTSAPLGQLISVSASTPIEVRFLDVDARNHDDAGRVTIDTLHDGDNRITSPFGAQAVLRAVTR